jgi:hypothetical protein
MLLKINDHDGATSRLASAARRPINGPLHNLLPGVWAVNQIQAVIKARLRRSHDASIRIGVSNCLVDARFDAGVSLENSANIIALHQNAGSPTPRSAIRLMIPFEKMQQNDPQRTFELVELFVAQSSNSSAIWEESASARRPARSKAACSIAQPYRSLS